MQIDIRITEVLSRVIAVDAASVEEAIGIVNKMYREAEIVLDYSDFDGNVVIEQEEDSVNQRSNS